MPFPRLEPVVELEFFARSIIIFAKPLLFLDLFQVGFHLADELDVCVLVDLVNLAVDYPQALLFIPPDTIQ